MEYTKQKDLGRFANRWACYATCFINIVETELGRGLTVEERFRVLGMWFMKEQIMMANYKDHKKIGKEGPGWKQKDDPEFHFLVMDQDQAIRDTLDLFFIPNLKREYEIVMLHTEYGTHFVLRIDGDQIVNPDPSLSGESVQIRKVK